ncbi:DUF2634 domain-containing protein [Lentilactobacillus sp. SPB1-3]|uniref:DUF2634 domain-containing protein n=1 Tax=Lentilactobacillus terminaliae TaxID=3003483 RepID=A0ACD5DD64_9LACO|nr:DUF2634 domain-containing protein [Lentilactobacillus sp. SPB1-3]MCZ0978122.1 DUF2634 domain-containing protein [Lentilactobacillus sp. SPB1-3]
MAVDFAYDQNGDLLMNNGSPMFISGLEELKQALSFILQTPKGYWIDEDVGMDFEWILNGYDEAGAKKAVEDTLLQDKRVTEVTYVEPEYQANQRTVIFAIKCQSTLGELDFTKEVNIDAIN